MCYFSPARQLYYAADACASLPESVFGPDIRVRAEAFAVGAVAAYQNASEAERSFGDQAGAMTDLAITRVRANDIEGASEAISPVLELSAPQRINGILRSMSGVHRALSASSAASSAACDLQEAIEDYCRAPAPALPQ